MSAFPQPFTGIAAPIMVDNVDTDTIIPSREMRSTGRDGLADGMFAPWRYSDVDARKPNPDFALNQPEFANATIIAGGTNFGCGSSREHAVWALAEYGIKAIIAESFAPIFQNNCVRNFLLPVALPRESVEACAGNAVTIDLAAQTVRCGDETYTFSIDPEAKQMLAEGLDAIDLTMTQGDAIAAWLAADKPARPWVYLEKPA
ncbi:3-isopropylmalate dehydratase small subunit [Altererythrobacter lutimaris]|uniref:3-isopropylmalate dehydratase small subunit n=1 Tax=Altererythrobacter lutimaris TaxID=2743979 RepID=A0A850HEN6_9SPHN|nr:3-isopropylmalate dehydratase small subunit [Altererythrobacter lutimaris]NVE95566.1 3-isopropylmalate dehydratase small subunit [Altererythrobacter lutimaris]